MHIFGNKLRNFRKEIGCKTQEDFAELLKCSREYIGQLEVMDLPPATNEFKSKLLDRIPHKAEAIEAIFTIDKEKTIEIPIKEYRELARKEGECIQLERQLEKFHERIEQVLHLCEGA